MEDEVLLQCVHLADQMTGYAPVVDGRTADDWPYDGMASAGVAWNPYEHRWVSSATWGSGTRLSGEPGETVIEAAVNLEARLVDELGCLRRGETRKKKQKAPAS